MIAKWAQVLALLALGAHAAVDEDRVTSLPGWDGPLPSPQYSGYLTVEGRKHFHYWLVESENDPANDPVVFWFNGGPGCSSVDGYLYEHGPLHVSDSNYSELVYFNYTWAKFANMVYLEAPVGVGFSYSDNSSDYVTNDDQAALDNVGAVEAFFASYSEYLENPFFLAGESYAGIYVPTLAEGILNAVEAGTYTGAALKGIAVGNGCSGDEIGTCGWGTQSTYYETSFLLEHAFVSPTLKSAIANTCDWDYALQQGGSLSKQCEKNILDMHLNLGNINIYNVYGDCVSGSEAELEGRKAVKAMRRQAPMWSQTVKGPNACIDSAAASAWINQPSVMEAIHVKQQPYEWSICGNQITYTSTRPNLPRDTYPMLNQNIRVLVYNGDWDACVPYIDNMEWTSNMQYQVKDAWHPWIYDESQVGGYATVYDTPYDFTFITVRGGRHEVPETAPTRAFAMFQNFITGADF